MAVAERSLANTREYFCTVNIQQHTFNIHCQCADTTMFTRQHLSTPDQTYCYELRKRIQMPAIQLLKVMTEQGKATCAIIPQSARAM
jgi:hypothetical protein